MSLWRFSSSSTSGTLTTSSSIWSAASFGSGSMPPPSALPCQSPESLCTRPYVANSSSTASRSAPKAPRNSSNCSSVMCFMLQSIPKCPCAALEFSACLQTTQYFRERIRALGYDENIRCRKRVVQLDGSRVVPKHAGVVIAHHKVRVRALARQPIRVSREDRYPGKERREVGTYVVLPPEHRRERVVIRGDGYDDKRRVLIHRVYAEKEVVAECAKKVVRRVCAHSEHEFLECCRAGLRRSVFDRRHDDGDDTDDGAERPLRDRARGFKRPVEIARGFGAERKRDTLFRE